MSAVRTCTLYRFFSAEEKLLYVGRTINPGNRMQKHAGTKPWWSDVARIAMEQYTDLPALIAAERDAIKNEQPLHNVQMNSASVTNTNGHAEQGWPSEIDGLVGRFFHSWRPRSDDDGEYATARGDNVVEWQGHVVDQVEPGVYIAELFSWWDGCPNGQKIVRVDDMALWTFYESALEMQVSLGCPQTDYKRKKDRCGGRVTHFMDRRKFDIGLGLLCYGCVKFYPGFRDAKPLKWDARGKPVLP